MNRFTQLTPARFNPMSWEEIASVPLAKRQQHDATQQALADMETTLAQIKSLEPHTAEAKALQDYYRNEISNLAGELSARGVSGDIRDRILQLNSKYKADLSPQGRLGQIQNAYTTYQTELDNYRKNADKKFGRDVIESGWQTHSQPYMESGYGPNNEIETITPYGAPSHFDIKSDVYDSKLGQIVRSLPANVTVEQTPEGYQYINKETGEDVLNSQQIKELTQGLAAEYLNPNTERGKYAEFMGLSKDEILNSIDSFANTMIVDKQTVNTSISNIPNQKTSSLRETPEEVDTIKSSIGLQYFYKQGYKSINDVYQIMNDKNATSQEKDKAKRAYKQYRNLFAQSEDYKFLKSKLTNQINDFKFSNDIKNVEGLKYELANDPSKLMGANESYLVHNNKLYGVVGNELHEFIKFNPNDEDTLKRINQYSASSMKNDPYTKTKKVADNFNKDILRKSKEDLQTMFEDNFNKMSTQLYEYDFTSLTDSDAKNLNGMMYRDFNNPNIINNFEVLGMEGLSYDPDADLDEMQTKSNAVDTDFIDRQFDVTNPEHKEIAFNLLTTAERDEFEFIGYGFNPVANLPYYKVKVNKKDKEGKTISRTITLGVDTIRNADNVESVAFQPLKRLKDFGGPKGEQLYNKFVTDIQTKDFGVNYRRNEFDSSLKERYKNIMSDNLDETFKNISGNSNYDLNIYKDNNAFKIQVKRSDKSKYPDLKWDEILNEDIITSVVNGTSTPKENKIFEVFTDYLLKTNPSEYEALIDMNDKNIQNKLDIINYNISNPNAFFEVDNKQDLFYIIQNY